MVNRLAHSTSPYLLQHAANPVDWHPWGPEALERSRQEQKPIFLSIGYSACHWCHVMEHESFENPRIAAMLNEHFVCIKVDREERPDLDQIYMTAVQLMTGRGGWPMSLFLTPELQPFYGGTYWPETARGGMPGFDQILAAVHDAWANRREQAITQAQQLTEYLRRHEGDQIDGQGASLSAELVQGAAASLERVFDFQHGGFGGAPKFPHPMDLRVLLRAWRRDKSRETPLSMATTTLDKMAAGGIYDQLGGGFHRYSVDERWLVPHFEKMLYDNALLASAYLEGFLATGNADYARVVRETLDYVLRDMADPAGGFYSTEDADSEGHEGKFYVWTPMEIEQVLGPEAAKTFCYEYDVSDVGNFESSNILNRPKTLAQSVQILGRDAGELAPELETSRAKLLIARNRRIRPGRDDKVLVSWNGLMIDALAQAAGPLDDPEYLDAAKQAADFILKNLKRHDGRLLHSWRAGEAQLDAYLDDYSYFANALVSLYEASFDERFIDEAVALADVILKYFADPAGSGFFFTASDHEQLIARPKEWHDSSTPSGIAMTATLLVRLGILMGRSDFLTAAEKTLRAASELMRKSPTAAGQMLLALDMHVGPTPEIVIIGDAAKPDTAAVIGALRKAFIPNKVVAARDAVPHGAPHRSAALEAVFAGKQSQATEPTVYVCRSFTCAAPVSGLQAALETWRQLAEG